MRRIVELARTHAATVDEFLDRASAVPREQWDVPRALGKWSPAQEVKHLTLGLEAFARDIRGEGKLRLKGTWWQRRLWRWTALPRILKTRQIFRPVRAPREVRPPEHPGEPAPLLEDLRLRARELEALVVETDRVNPHCCVTHPYFGALSLEKLLRFSVIHVRHHAAFLPTFKGSEHLKVSSALTP